MKEEMRENLIDEGIWMRGVFMVFFNRLQHRRISDITGCPVSVCGSPVHRPGQ